MNEFLEQFVIESRELIDQATRDLLELEQNPQDRQRLDSAFRAFHTLKGGAGIVEFEAMGRALHVVEDALAAVRSGNRTLSAKLIGDCLASLDQTSAWLAEIEQRDDLPLNADAAAQRIATSFAEKVVTETSIEAPTYLGQEIIAAQIALIDLKAEAGTARRLSALTVAANVLRARGDIAAADALIIVDSANTDAVRAALTGALVNMTAGAARSVERDQSASRALRIDVSRIDALVKLTGELTAAKNAIGHVADFAGKDSDPARVATLLKDNHALLDRLVSELQRSVLNVRVLPIGPVFQRFPRLVREMASELDKPTRVVMHGEDTEADKTIVDTLFEPLLHIIRNAIDHGIEDAATRKAAAKPGVARIDLSARRQGEHVVVEVRDDGAGVDEERVRAMAVSKGLLEPAAANILTDDETLELLFLPGFSTAREVTQLSGRGVGMDAVRAAMRAVGGDVELSSTRGQGTAVRLLLPFTLMMTRVMVVYAGGQAFGVPFDAVVETVRTPRGELSKIGTAPAFVHRDQTVPLVDLPAVLKVDRAAVADQAATIVLTNVNGELLGFEVEKVGSSLDVMLAPLEGLLAGANGIAGATVLGDGSVLIVLDLVGLAE